MSSRSDEVLNSDGNSYLLSIDPGRSTGISLGIFSDAEAYELVDSWQPRGGAEGFIDWWQSGKLFAAMGPWTDGDVMISERFILRSSPKDGRVPDIEPVRIEGVMLGMGLRVLYQDRWMKASVDDQILKDHGLWVTNKEARERFDHTDARDVNDSIIHGLAFLKSRKHLPTLRKFWA